MNYIFYHKIDYDGKCSGAIAALSLKEYKLCPINYGEEFPFEIIKKDDIVYMLDFSLQPFDQMIKLNNSCKLVWIDHHKSAIEEYKKSGATFNCKLISSVAACESVWNFFHTTPAPISVKLLSLYDIWDKKDPRVDQFQCGVGTIFELDPTKTLEDWGKVLQLGENDVEFQEVIKNGIIIEDYRKNDAEEKCKAMYWTDTIFGHKAVIANCRGNSMFFDSVYDKEQAELMILFNYFGPSKTWTVSLYSKNPNVECGNIAKQHGGGGHKGAAGYQTNDLSEILKNVAKIQ